MAKEVKEKIYKVQKSDKYRGSIRPVLGGDKTKALLFDAGKTITVTSKQWDVIKKLGWGTLSKKEVK